MQIRYYKEYSEKLNRDMEFKVYGHAGKPCLVFPAQDGRFYDFENFKMVDAAASFIEEGRLQLFCCDSIDQESWSRKDGSPRERIEQHERWFHYICDELCPRIFRINAEGNDGHYASGIMTTGCSMGATHALNFMLRRPDIFDAVIAMSGAYHANMFFHDYCDDLVYNNSPMQYLEGMPNDHYYVDLYRQRTIILCTGQGAWEVPMVDDARRMKELFDYKGIPAWVDFWGHDVCHDWPWWRIQFPYFLSKTV